MHRNLSESQHKVRSINMEIKKFGNQNGKRIMMLHGNLMC